ncbi:DNA cytosine methyltransferase [Mycetocola saprophilus]|uniref:DNA cytosine methyltransferase n=1 Tax=Mycetocola saprophilus TaxID=76636 RepID=UPI000AAE53CF
MTGLTIGSLFSGVGGLDMGAERFFNARPAWFVEFDSAPSKVLAHRWPGIPNFGDITTVDWNAVPRVDILTGGFPCQDLSLAGRRAGMRPGTRSGLWADYLAAIAAIKPRMVVIENVRGLLSGAAESDSDLEPGAGFVGDGHDGPVLRALGRVLGDLAGIGYDARWCGLRAADAGAPHGRFRVFVVAYPAGDPGRFWDRDDVSVGGVARRFEPDAGRGAFEDPDSAACGERGCAASRSAESGRARADTCGRGGVPAPDALGIGSEGWGHRVESQHATDAGCAPAASDSGGCKPERRRGPDAVAGAAGTGESHRSEWERIRHAPGDSGAAAPDTESLGQLHGYPEHLGTTCGDEHSPGNSGDAAGRISGSSTWGEFWPAINRWRSVIGRDAPAPTRPDGRDGRHRLNPELTEWMMGWPAGHVTAPEIGLSRAEQLKACGNGVVPQQAFLALAVLLGRPS